MAKKPTALPSHESARADDPIDRQPEKSPTLRTSNTELPKPTVVKPTSASGRRRLPIWIWYAAAGLVILVVAGVLGWKLFGSSPAPTNTVVTNTSTEKLVPRVLDGVPVQADRAFTNIYAVVIENMVDSRPPSGLDKASVIYETLAEGGITRFLALWPVGQAVDQIGPVRSARPYFISWAAEYKPLFVHAGGSPQALATLKSSQTNVYDFNQFTHGGNFVRDNTRPAPHNLYTDPDKLYSGLRNSPARDAVPTYTSWLFKGEPPFDNRPATVNDLVIDFSSFSYKVTYKYDRVQNSYLRFVADQPHLTRDGVQLVAKNIMVQFEKIGLIANDKQRLDIQTIGSGKLLLFRDGTVTSGTWKKDSDAARTQWLDASGNALALNPGQIWIETVPTDAKVTY